jgi:hypothetical protein
MLASCWPLHPAAALLLLAFGLLSEPCDICCSNSF